MYYALQKYCLESIRGHEIEAHRFNLETFVYTDMQQGQGRSQSFSYFTISTFQL